MNCPKCDSFFPVVSNWKTSNSVIHRKRVCKECGYELVTVEILEEDYKSYIKLVKDLKSVIKTFLAD